MRRATLVLLIVAPTLTTMTPGTVSAQVDGYHMTGINFNFSNPGARARGIGGAFVALADDATAGIANPAGLAFLDRQVTLELAHDEEIAPVGPITQGEYGIEGEFPDIFFFARNDPFRVWAESKTNRINYASFVFPIPSINIGISVYYAALANLKQDYEVGQGLMCLENGSPYLPTEGDGCTVFDESFGTFYAPFDVSARLESELLGFGFGWKLSDSFALGASVAYARTTFTGTSTTSGIRDPSGIQITGSGSHTSSVDDNDAMYSLGLLYRGNILGVGLNYRSEMSFGIDNDILDEEGNSYPNQSFRGEFRIPERLAAGLAFFPGDHWVIAAEYVRIPYSTMPKGMPDQFNFISQLSGVTFASADIDEYHLGGEYTTFGDGKGWSIRAGYWRNQSHLIYSSQGYEDPIDDPGSNYEDVSVAAAALLHQELDLDFDHFTAGFGGVIGHFRVDLAVDYSPDAGTDFLLSGVFYF